MIQLTRSPRSCSVVAFLQSVNDQLDEKLIRRTMRVRGVDRAEAQRIVELKVGEAVGKVKLA